MSMKTKIDEAMRKKYHLDTSWNLVSWGIEYSTQNSNTPVWKASYETALGEKLTGIIELSEKAPSQS